eukprot:UN25762
MDIVFYNNIFLIVKRTGDIEWAKRVLNKITNLPGGINYSTYDIFIRICRDVKDGKSAWEFYEKYFDILPTPYQITLDNLCMALATSGEVDKLLNVFGQYKSRNIKPGAKTYSAILNACRTTNNSVLCLRVFDNMKDLKIEPNYFDHITLFNALKEGGDYENIVFICRDMQKQLIDNGIYYFLAGCIYTIRTLERGRFNT